MLASNTFVLVDGLGGVADIRRLWAQADADPYRIQPACQRDLCERVLMREG